MTEERFLKVTEPDLPDMDAALSWVVQTIDAEGIEYPNITVTALHDLEGVTRYEASVSGLIDTKAV